MSFTSINDVPPTVVSPNGMAYDSDVEAELEVDQLDSDSEPENSPDATKGPASTKSTTKPGERVPGQSLLPASRLENMIQADGTTGNMAVSKEGLFVLSIATEEFIKQFIQAGHREASAQRRNQINYSDMANTARQYQEFMFLSDTIPLSIGLQEAMQLREAKERELLEDNPALAPALSTYSVRPSPDPVPYSAPPPKPRKSTNGSGSHSSKRARVSEPAVQGNPYPVLNGNEHTTESRTNGGSSSHSRRSRNGASSSSHPSPSVNGHSVPPPPSSRSQTSSYPIPREHSMDSDHSPVPYGPAHYPEPSPQPHSPPAQGEEDGWPYTGPASGFMRGTGPSLSRGSQNPGRTIYSQQHQGGAD